MNRPVSVPESTAFERDVRRRHFFSLLLVLATLCLVSWGGFVTSINAGMAVPDWPTSFNSLDPFNPWPEWWTITPVLAEHGHRLLGATVGLLTLLLAAWTVLKDRRPLLRRLAVGAFVLVVLQGVLGGLRVLFVSLNLAMVHAAVAQLFFSLAVVLALITSRSWSRREGILAAHNATAVRVTARTAVVAMYGQILLGALLRHPGSGIDSWLAALHIGGAIVATGAVVALYMAVRWFAGTSRVLQRAALAGMVFLSLQVALGLFAYFVTLDDAGMVEPSNVQVLINTLHLVVGTCLMASTVTAAVLAHRREIPEREPLIQSLPLQFAPN